MVGSYFISLNLKTPCNLKNLKLRKEKYENIFTKTAVFDRINDIYYYFFFVTQTLRLDFGSGQMLIFKLITGRIYIILTKIFKYTCISGFRFFYQNIF